MNSHRFGHRNGELTRAAQQTLNRAAKKHGASLVYEVSGGARAWFACEDQGAERNAEIERAVRDELARLVGVS